MSVSATIACALCGWVFTEPDAHERFCSIAEHMEAAHHFPVSPEVRPLLTDKALWTAAAAQVARRAGRAQWN